MCEYRARSAATLAGRARVYVALHALRKLGMRAVLERRDDGYVLLVDAEIAGRGVPSDRSEPI